MLGMNTKTGRILRAGAMLVGTVVGAGIFGIPYAIAQGGAWVALIYFFAIGGIVIFIYLAYGEVVLRTRGTHRMVGYAEHYLGRWGRRLATAISVVGIYGILTAHLIIGGFFLQVVLGPAFPQPDIFWSTVYFLIVATVVFFRLAVVAKVETWLTGTFLILIVMITAWAARFVSIAHFALPGSGSMFLPYGVIFFSLIGASAIPQMRDALAPRTRLMRPVMVGSLLTAIIFTAVFAFIIFGVTGAVTTADALLGLRSVAGNAIVILGSGFGLLSVLTTSMAIALYLKEVYEFDYHFDKTFSWFLAVVVPYLFLVFFSPNFIHTVAITGAVMGGMDGILIVLMHRRAKIKGDRKPEYHIWFPRPLGNLLMLLFALGIVLELWSSR